MKRITKLTLKNFKAFREQSFNFKGRHVLVYGNNGSGKSSIYWALYTLFESSGKGQNEPKKYFDNPVTEKQSLRNVNAPLSEGASIAIEWRENAPLPTMRQNERQGKCLVSDRTNEAGVQDIMNEASQGSDFVSYRLFQHFNGSNRHDVNLWPAFARDILPYYLSTRKQPATGPKPGSQMSFAAAVEDFATRRASMDREQAAHPRKKYDKQEKDFAQEWSDFNEELKRFIAAVEAEANAYLDYQAQRAKVSPLLTLALRYEPGDWMPQGSLRSLADQPADEKATFFRQHQFANIKLAVIAARNGNSSHTADRPQTFLNEARLTRVAIALRLGALLTRLPTSFNLLCFDDVLVSLDMTNRLDVLDWLFSHQVTDSNGHKISLLERYQVIFLTHDRELYDAVNHYATHCPPARQANGKPEEWAKWVRYELYLDEHSAGLGPHVAKPDEGGNNYLEQADSAFVRFDYPACANYLRKFCERQISNFLPDRLLYEPKGPSGEIKLKDLERQLSALKSYLTDVQELNLGATAFDPFVHLTLYRKLHLNPLSHHHPQPISLPSELQAFRNTIVPALEGLKAIEQIGTQSQRETFANLSLEEATSGKLRTFRIRLREPLRELTVSPLLKQRSNSQCEVMGELLATGAAPVLMSGFPFNPPDLDQLHGVYAALATLLGYDTANPTPDLINASIIAA